MTTSTNYLWIEAQKRRKKDREVLRQTVLKELNNALKRLEREYPWTDLYLFGSITKDGRFGRSSDVDIALSGLEKSRFYSFVGELSSVLGCSVDVVNLEECAFSEAIVSRGLKWSSRKKYGFF